MLAATAIVALFVRTDLLRGLVIGFGVAAAAGALSHWVIVSSGAGPLMMGELAEQWTASEVRPLMAKGWRLINHVALPSYGDIDHLLLGTSGVFVIETRWSGLDWKSAYGADRVDRKVRQAKRAADELSKTSPYKSLGLPAPKPLVVLWGPGAEDLAASLGRPNVLAGRHLAARLDAFGMVGARLTVNQLRAAWEALSADVLAEAVREAVRNPMPASAQEVVFTLIGSLLSGLVAFVVAVDVLALHIPVVAVSISALAIGLVAQPLRRWPRLVPAVTGWQAGVVMAVVLFAIVTGGHVARWS